MSHDSDRGGRHSHPKAWLAMPILVAVIQVIGTNGAARWAGRNRGPWNWQHPTHGEPVAVHPIAYLFALVGPLLLFGMRRFPRSVIAATAAVAIGYYSLGYPAAPVFLAPLVAMVNWFKMVRAERRTQARQVERAEAARIAGAERLRIAQELHDVLAHHISLINVQSGVALHLIDEKPEQTRTALAAIKGTSKEALVALRGALDALRNIDDTAPRTPTAGLSQVDALAAGLEAAGVSVDIAVEGTAVPIDPAVDLAALRIVQESLTNVLRHSGADHAAVTIEYGPDRLGVRVRDNGVGGVPLPGNGIAGMRERAAALGGDCSVGPARGAGFEVHAHFPYRLGP